MINKNSYLNKKSDWNYWMLKWKKWLDINNLKWKVFKTSTTHLIWNT